LSHILGLKQIIQFFLKRPAFLQDQVIDGPAVRSASLAIAAWSSTIKILVAYSCDRHPRHDSSALTGQPGKFNLAAKDRDPLAHT